MLFWMDEAGSVSHSVSRSVSAIRPHPPRIAPAKSEARRLYAQAKAESAMRSSRGRSITTRKRVSTTTGSSSSSSFPSGASCLCLFGRRLSVKPRWIEASVTVALAEPSPCRGGWCNNKKRS